jgi:phage terminase small subunit
VTDSEGSKGGGGLAAKVGAIANAPGTGRFMGSHGLTDKQADFVSGYIANGGNATQAARSAGYANPESDGWRVMRNEAVQGAIRAEFERRVRTEGVAIGYGVLVAVASDKAQSGAARTMAAKELVRLAGYGPRESITLLDDKPLGERTLAELDAFIAGGMARLDALQEAQGRTIEGDAPRVIQRMTVDSAESP